MIVSIIGARPQFVKAAVLSRELAQSNVPEFIIHTGQHYDYKMNEVFFSELGLRGADVNLNVGSGTHAQQTAIMLQGIEEILIKKQEELSSIVVFGDTNSTIAGALAAAKLCIPIVHVEAGLRSFNRSMPEEVNRVVTDHLSELLFCSSEAGRTNLAVEGITRGVYVCGDIMLDAFNVYRRFAEKKFNISDIIPKEIVEDYYLLTIHRPVNTDSPENITQVLSALRSIKSNIVWPVHPRTKRLLDTIALPANVFIFDAFSYFEMMVVLEHAKKVLTDSGGLQKEAYWAKKPCITLRSETEWVETLHDNWNILVGAKITDIENAASVEVDLSTWTQLYGNGDSARQMVEIIKAKNSCFN
jgi:UDP-N-acetylglucosamine 2-epimerase